MHAYDRAVASWMDLLSHRATQRVRLRYRCRDGSWLWIELEQVHNGAEDPDKVDVNVRCLDGVDIAAIKPQSFDGKNWEHAIAAKVPWR